MGIGIERRIASRTWALLKESIHVLLEGTPVGIDVDGVHDLHIWSLASGKNSLTAHIVRGENSDADSFVNKKFYIAHTTFQIELAACDQDEHGWSLMDADGGESEPHRHENPKPGDKAWPEAARILGKL